MLITGPRKRSGGGWCAAVSRHGRITVAVESRKAAVVP